ncbi:arsenite methyltransferase [candidate division KSB1 bacterium]
MKKDKTREFVREEYSKVVEAESSCCEPKSCGCGSSVTAEEISSGIGYSDDEMTSVPEGSNLGLGCGNPIALASLEKGDTVMDLGSGAGFDCFLAANEVGETGKVIGVDMTPAMLDKARENAEKGGYKNVEFRMGEIENIPSADNQIDVMISNCVINLSPDKDRVFAEAFRVLKPGGRMMISDIVLLGELPEMVIDSVSAYAGCISGAMQRDDYLAAIRNAGFENIEIQEETKFSSDFIFNDPAIMKKSMELNIDLATITDLSDNIVRSIKISAKKPI